VQRIDTLVGSIPSAREMARTMSAAEVRDLAEERGKQLRDRGVTVDYAPDTDVSDQPARSVIGDRAFSADPDVVRQYALAFAEGLQAAGVRPVLKHFPGHGRADGDSHQSLVATPPLDDLRDNDLVPYEQIGEYGEVGVMVGHLDVPGLTSGAPASLSEDAYRLLRTEYEFTGPAITDDLGAMRAISDQYSLPEAVLRALDAGADQALWSSGGRTAEVLDRLEQALGSGDLPEQRVREALARVLLAKGTCG
jgi:beta-N-acetylhexosaminidase